MPRKLLLGLFLLAPALLPPAVRAEEPVDLSMMTRIREEGFHRSQVMDTLFHLADVIGPRLTGSPQLKQANDWTRRQFETWGLANAHLEGYPFGRGWSFSACEVRMVAPREVPIIAWPKAWTPATPGPVRGEVLQAEIKAEKDLEDLKGKVAGKIVFVDAPADFEEPEDPAFRRYTPDTLSKLGEYEIPGEEHDWRKRGIERYRLLTKVNEFMEKEKALAMVEVSARLNGIVRVSGGGSHVPGESVGVPALVMAAEPYNQILRLIEDGQKVELEVGVAARFHEDDLEAYNTVAEIPGTDKKDELVMAGAHLDSWHAGTGATDNGAGSAVVMEAARILKALGVKPRRTLRFVLWTGEEQGYLGSLAYMEQHFATRPENTDPEQKDLPARYRTDTWPLKLKPEHAKVAAYFNLDNGTGKVRGIYTEENGAVGPIFQSWLAPFADLGATQVTMNTTGGTDHVPFDRIGLPGFQFIQDEMDYETRTHHTNLDTYDHVRREDMMQASVLMAAFLYDAAMRPEPLPRKPLPQEPPAKKKKASNRPDDER